ncbi:glycosyl hydrolase [Kitasatospora sp. NPDC057965]|uniref:glycosyl hydrolase n=1 Tax=Kitasatospora sp. NPDC057965 TaxID=3346291 RepID=UPI0036D818F8
MVLAAQHRADPSTRLRTSHVIAFDRSAIYGVPGEPDIVAVHLERDDSAGTIRAAMKTEALVPLAERWLIARGADPEQLAQTAIPIRPADPLTRQIEEFLRSSGDRFTVRGSFTDESEPYDIWVIAQDTAPSPAEASVRVWHNRRQVDSDTYTVREGGFADLDAAYAWTRDTSAPLPPVTSPSARAAAARHSTVPAAGRPRLDPTPVQPPPGPGRPRSGSR